MQFLPPEHAVHMALSRLLVLQGCLVVPSKAKVPIALCCVRILGDAVSSARFEIQTEQIENGTEVARRVWLE